jgi:hypothetical protein
MNHKAPSSSKSISQHFGIAQARFAATGAFDAILDVDSKLFIDPQLLRHTAVPELKGAYATVQKRFREILKLLQQSKSVGDIFWREADKRLVGSEIQGICIGYSSKGTAGSGLGRGLRTEILSTAKEIVDVGVADPEIFELVGLLQEKVGPDRISDLVSQIIIGDLLTFSHRVFASFDIEKEKYDWQDRQFELPVNPYNETNIIVVPCDVLRDLPIAYCWEDIDTVCAYNAALRNKVNSIIGDSWKQATRIKKRSLRNVLTREPELLKDLISTYRSKPPRQYDFVNDPAGQFIWLTAAQEATTQSPLPLSLPPQPTPDEVHELVLQICDKYRDLIENNALCSLLYDTNNAAKGEEAAQKLFYGIADAYCEANNIDLTRECNAGRGPVDFKFSNGYLAKVLVETKLSTNKQLIHGFHTQLQEYQKAEKAIFSVYLILGVIGGSPKRIRDLQDVADDARLKGLKVPTIVHIDAIPKVSASKFHT